MDVDQPPNAREGNAEVTGAVLRNKARLRHSCAQLALASEGAVACHHCAYKASFQQELVFDGIVVMHVSKGLF